MQLLVNIHYLIKSFSLWRAKKKIKEKKNKILKMLHNTHTKYSNDVKPSIYHIVLVIMQYLPMVNVVTNIIIKCQ